MSEWGPRLGGGVLCCVLYVHALRLSGIGRYSCAILWERFVGLSQPVCLFSWLYNKISELWTRTRQCGRSCSWRGTVFVVRDAHMHNRPVKGVKVDWGTIGVSEASRRWQTWAADSWYALRMACVHSGAPPLSSAACAFAGSSNALPCLAGLRFSASCW